MAFLKLPELDTTSVLHIVEKNFKKANLKTYGVRMIYFGEHGLVKEDMIEQFRKTINSVNQGYCGINVNGLLLVYDSYFVHIIEGSEDTIHRQLRFLFQREIDWIAEMKKKDEEEAEAARRAVEEAAAEGIIITLEEPEEKPERHMFRGMKVLMVYHSITTLLFDGWRALTARPPSLVGTLDVFGPLSEHIEQLRICLDKLTKLVSLAKAEQMLSFDGLSANDPKMEALPEVALLEYLLKSQYILDLRQVLYLHRRVDDYQFYFEHVWPLPTHFTPRYLYKLKIDDSFVEPLPIMPWEIKTKEEEEENEDQEPKMSDSDSSD